MTAARPAKTSSFDCSSYARGIAQVMGLKESDLNRFLRGTGLLADVLYEDSGVHMDLDQFVQVIRNVQQMSEDEDIGLRCGQDMQRSVHGPIRYLSLNAQDLYSALSIPAEFKPIQIPLVDTRLNFRDGFLHCELMVLVNVEDAVRRIVLEAFALTVQANVELFLGHPLVDGVFQFDFPAPPYAARYAEYIHCAVQFDAPQTTLVLPDSLARQARPDRDPHAYIVAHELCREFLAGIPDTHLDVVDRTRRILLSNALGEFHEADVARALFVSKRTLARRLGERGTSYREVRDNLLADLSARYLRDENLSVEAISLLLGYQDVANFRRAFKRWHGVPPSDFRRRFSEVSVS